MSNEIEKLSVTQEELDLIEVFYKRAFIFLSSNCKKEAKTVLYNKMPLKLYDISLDILNNRNNKFVNNSLRNLIIRVDDLLTDKEDEITSDLSDNYGDIL